MGILISRRERTLRRHASVNVSGSWVPPMPSSPHYWRFTVYENVASSATSTDIPLTHHSLSVPQSIDLTADSYDRPKSEMPDICERDANNAWQVKEPFNSSLSTVVRIMVLTLFANGHTAAASRIATCCYFGTAYKQSKCRKRARAFRHSCHSWMCNYCGQARNRLYSWGKNHRAEVATTPQVGIELIAPAGTPEAKLHKVAKLLVKAVDGQASLRHTVIDPSLLDSRLRMAIPSDYLNYTATLSTLQRLAPTFRLQLHLSDSPKEVLEWVFRATDGIWSLSGETRAALFIARYRSHMLQASGQLYAKRKGNEDGAELGAQHNHAKDGDGDSCPCCGPMEVIPHDQRQILPAEKIDLQYEHVDWSGSSYNPFSDRRVKLNYSRPHTVKYVGCTAITLGDSRYGPN